MKRYLEALHRWERAQHASHLAPCDLALEWAALLAWSRFVSVAMEGEA